MRHVLTAVAVSLVSLALFACGGETTPSADAPAGGTTATGTTATAGGTTTSDTTATTATATAAQPRDSSGMSLDEYLPICASPISGPIDVEATIEGLATVLGEFTKRLEAVEPPAEVADWHDAILVYQKALKKALDGGL